MSGNVENKVSPREAYKIFENSLKEIIESNESLRSRGIKPLQDVYNLKTQSQLFINRLEGIFDAKRDGFYGEDGVDYWQEARNLAYNTLLEEIKKDNNLQETK